MHLLNVYFKTWHSSMGPMVVHTASIRGKQLKEVKGHTRAYPFLLKDPQVAEEHCKGETAMSFKRRTHRQTLKFANEADSPQNCKNSSSGSVKGVKGMTCVAIPVK